MDALKPGLKGSATLVVGEEHTAPRIGSGRVHVLATPVMINLFEAAALDAIERLLPPGHQSLGTVLNVRHIAATPVGMRVTASAEVVGVEGRAVRFRVEAHARARGGECRQVRPAGAAKIGVNVAASAADFPCRLSRRPADVGRGPRFERMNSQGISEACRGSRTHRRGEATFWPREIIPLACKPMFALA
jgi:predicted thioesterase